MTPYFSQSSKRVCVPEFEQSALAAAHNSAGARDHRQRAQEIRVSLFYLLQDEENMQTSEILKVGTTVLWHTVWDRFSFGNDA